MIQRVLCRARVSAGLLLVIVFTGCEKPYHVAEVDGVLLAQGKPASKVKVQFVPDTDRGTNGPISMADTDPAGRFKLELRALDGNSQSGAVVGWHRVILSDKQLAESATGRDVPIRFGPEYTQPSSTPLMQEVKEGKQTIEIWIP